MPYDLSVYNYTFYLENQREGLLHAEWFMPLLLKTFDFSSLVDVGCGTGHFLKWCADNGISDTLGIEGSRYAYKNALVPIELADLRYPFEAPRRFDLALSVEVAEHLEEEYASTFVDTLCALSDTVVLTAAQPGQGGHWHMNEKPDQYWETLFRDRSYYYSKELTDDLRRGIKSARLGGKHVATWLSNIRVYWKFPA